MFPYHTEFAIKSITENTKTTVIVHLLVFSHAGVLVDFFAVYISQSYIFLSWLDQITHYFRQNI